LCRQKRSHGGTNRWKIRRERFYERDLACVMNRSVWILNYTRRYNKATRTNSDMIKYMQQVTLEAVLERCTYCRTGVVTDLMNDKAATGC